jgi:uncharacterized protein YjbI with pentapeptide repeats
MHDMRTFTRCLVGAAAISGTLFFSASVRCENNAEIQTAIDTLISTNACVGCDLAGADLNRLDLTGADLSNADLRDARFFLADLTDVNFSGAILHGAQFGGADLSNADFSGADLRGALFAGAYMVGSKMDGAIVQAPLDEDSSATETVYVPDESTSKSVVTQDDVAIEPDTGSVDTVDSQAVQKVAGSGPATLLATRHEPAKKEPAPLTTAMISETPAKTPMPPPAEKENTPSADLAEAPSDSAPPDLDKQDESQESPGLFARFAGLFSSDENEKQQETAQTEPAEDGQTGDPQPLSTVTEETVAATEAQVPGRKAETPPPTTPAPAAVRGDQKDTGSGSSMVAGADNQTASSEPPVEPLPPAAAEVEVQRSTSAGQFTENELPTEPSQEIVISEEIATTVSEAEALVFLEPDMEAIRLGNRETLLDTDRCYGCDLRGVDLSGKRLGKADLEGADLSGATLRGTNFSRANLKGVLFRGADARGAKFQKADLYKADFTGANLSDADFEDAEVDGAVFTGAAGYGGSR